MSSIADSNSLQKATANLFEKMTSQENKYFLIEEFVIALGYNTAVFLGYLLNKHFFYQRNDQMVSHYKHGDGWFYFTIDSCEQQLHLSRHEQDSCVKKLQNMKLIEVAKMGVTGQSSIRRYFRLNLVMISETTEREEVIINLRETGRSTCRKPAGRRAGKQQSLPINNIYNNMLKKEDGAPSDDDAEIFSFSSASDSLEQENQHNITCIIKANDDSNPPKKSQKTECVDVTEDENIKLLKRKGKSLEVSPSAQEIAEFMVKELHAENDKYTPKAIKPIAIALKELTEANPSDEIRNVFLWALKHEFWGPHFYIANRNVGKFFAERYAQFFAAMKADKKIKSKDKSGNYNIARKYVDSFESKDYELYCNEKSIAICPKVGGRSVELAYNMEDFENTLRNELKKRGFNRNL